MLESLNELCKMMYERWGYVIFRTYELYIWVHQVQTAKSPPTLERIDGDGSFHAYGINI